MNLVDLCRERIRLSAARKPLLVIPVDRLDEFLEGVYELSPLRKELDGVPWLCAQTMKGSPCVVDLVDLED